MPQRPHKMKSPCPGVASIWQNLLLLSACPRFILCLLRFPAALPFSLSPTGACSSPWGPFGRACLCHSARPASTTTPWLPRACPPCPALPRPFLPLASSPARRRGTEGKRRDLELFCVASAACSQPAEKRSARVALWRFNAGQFCFLFAAFGGGFPRSSANHFESDHLSAQTKVACAKEV